MNVSLIYFVLLRILHFFGGVFWVGGMVAFHFYVNPSAKATAPEGQKFLQYFAAPRRFPLFMNLAGLVTILSGALLYWLDSSSFQLAWITSGPGVGFTLGSVVAIVVYIFGSLVIRPRTERLGKLGHAIATAGGPPTTAQVTELQKIDMELKFAGWANVVLLTVSLLAMATARFWSF